MIHLYNHCKHENKTDIIYLLYYRYCRVKQKCLIKDKDNMHPCFYCDCSEVRKHHMTVCGQLRGRSCSIFIFGIFLSQLFFLFFFFSLSVTAHPFVSALFSSALRFRQSPP